MKTKFCIYLIGGALLMGLCACGNKTPQNVKKSTGVTTTNDQNLTPDVLVRQAKAYYDLDQFKKSQEKVDVLLEKYPEAPETTNLTDFLSNLKEKMAAIEKSEDEKLADSLYQERQKRLPSAIEKMRKTEAGGGIQRYVDLTSPKFDTKECFYAYFTKGVDTPKLFFKIKYVASQWLNIENYIVTVDQKDYMLEETVIKNEAKGKKKLIQETLDMPIDSKEKIDMLYAIAHGEKIEAVYVGQAAHKKRDISEEQRLAVRNVLDAYEFYGGELYKE